MEVKFNNSDRYYFDNNFFHFEPFAYVDEDTVSINNIHLRILKSGNDSFKVKVLKLAYGTTKREAEQRAENINFNISQTDSVLNFDRGIPVTKTDKFRNQSVYITIYVPVGKRIYVDDNIGWGNDFHIDLGNDVDDWNWRRNNEGYDWSNSVEYIMTNDGLKPTHPTENNDDNDNNNSDDQPASPAAPEEPSKADSSKYHYQPSNNSSTDTIKKEASINRSSNIKSRVNITDIASSFFERLSL